MDTPRDTRKGLLVSRVKVLRAIASKKARHARGWSHNLSYCGSHITTGIKVNTKPTVADRRPHRTDGRKQFHLFSTRIAQNAENAEKRSRRNKRQAAASLRVVNRFRIPIYCGTTWKILRINPIGTFNSFPMLTHK